MALYSFLAVFIPLFNSFFAVNIGIYTRSRTIRNSFLIKKFIFNYFILYFVSLKGND